MERRSKRQAVMIIDDDTSRRKKIYDVVKLVGVDLSSAVCGTEAMGRIPREQPSLIIVNLYSNQVGGADFVKELRTYGLGQKIKVLGIVKADEQQKKMAVAVGVDTVLERDPEPYLLVELVCNQLGIHKIEIPKEQLIKRREIVEEVVAGYQAQARKSKTSGGRLPALQLFLPDGQASRLLRITEDAGKPKTEQ